jgi:hypothetical protein
MEWVPLLRENILYAISYDRTNNLVYISTYKPPQFQYQSGFFVFKGTYVDVIGSIATPEVGPARKFNDLRYTIDNTNSQGSFSNILLARSASSHQWDTIAVNIPQNYDLTSIDNKYEFIKMNIIFVDTSTQTLEPIKFKDLKVNFSQFPDIHIAPNYLTFQKDTILQGYENLLNIRAKNVGSSDVDSAKFDFYINNSDNPVFSNYFSIKKDSILNFSKPISTDTLLYTAPISEAQFRVLVTAREKEFYTFNNITENSFYVSRDSLSPKFKITFDGKEILNNDLVSAEPEVLITLEDNSPLPLDTTHFTIIHNNIPLRFSNPAISFSYTPYPNSKALVSWKPKLKDGRHILEILAKDASNNFFDTVSYRVIFYVTKESDMKNVYNYPNPFKDDTYFTFEITGINPPDEIKIKIFTVAGRLIREISVPSSKINMGFNKIAWDGRDQEGDEIANGVYLYKVITKFNDKIKTSINKISKLK